jgi:hypothetical protein
MYVGGDRIAGSAWLLVCTCCWQFGGHSLGGWLVAGWMGVGRDAVVIMLFFFFSSVEKERFVCDVGVCGWRV